MKARYLVNKAKRLEERLHDLQADLYNFSSELDDLGLKQESEMAIEAGFELDVSHTRMNDMWNQIENAYCRKITSK